MGYYQLSTDRITWTDILPDPTVVVYRPWADVVERLDGTRRGLGFATLEWDWGQTLMSGSRLYALQQFCPAGQAHSTVYVRSLIDDVASGGRREQKTFRGTMSRVRVDEHLFRAEQDWVRGVGVVFDELVEAPGFGLGAVCEFDAAYGHAKGVAIDADGGSLYCGTSTGYVLRVSINEMLVTGAVSTGLGGIGVGRLDTDGGFGYFPEDAVTPTRIVKVALADLTVSATLTLPAGDGGAVYPSMVLDVDGGFGYIGKWLSPGRVVKFRLSDMTRTDEVNLAGGAAADQEHYVGGLAIDVEQGVLYCVTQKVGVAATRAHVIRLTLSPFARDDSVSLPAECITATSCTIDTTEGLLLVPTAQPSNNQIAVISVSPMAYVRSVDFPEDSLGTMAVKYDRTSGYSYTMQRGQAGPLCDRWLYPSLSFLDTLALSSYGVVWWPAIDNRFPYLYAPTLSGFILKIGGGA